MYEIKIPDTSLKIFLKSLTLIKLVVSQWVSITNSAEISLSTPREYSLIFQTYFSRLVHMRVWNLPWLNWCSHRAVATRATSRNNMAINLTDQLHSTIQPSGPHLPARHVNLRPVRQYILLSNSGNLENISANRILPNYPPSISMIWSRKRVYGKKFFLPVHVAICGVPRNF